MRIDSFRHQEKAVYKEFFIEPKVSIINCHFKLHFPLFYSKIAEKIIYPRYFSNMII